ncbi:MAG: nitroreductase family protein [Spirochaetales bacterium]
MDFFETVKKRHSYRDDFSDKPVKKEDIEMILDAAIRAPSGCNGQTTSFIAVTDKDILQKLAQIVEKPVTKTAPCVIAVLCEHRIVYNDMAFEIEDYAASVENLLLAVTALGYASVWLDGYTRQGTNSAQIAKLLNVPENLTVRCLIPIGVPTTEVQQRERKSFNERVHWNTYS